MSAIRRSAIVPYSAHEMYALVSDIGAYSQFLPWCSESRILRQQGDTAEAAITIGYHGVHKSFTTRNLLQQDKMMEIRLVEGPFRYLNGYWRFTPLAEGACKVELDLEFEVANRLLSAVMTPVFSGIASQLVDAFHARAMTLYGPRSTK